MYEIVRDWEIGSTGPDGQPRAYYRHSKAHRRARHAPGGATRRPSSPPARLVDLYTYAGEKGVSKCSGGRRGAAALGAGVGWRGLLLLPLLLPQPLWLRPPAGFEPTLPAGRLP